MTNFEKSEIYKKALAEYQDKIYGEILKPLHSIVIDEDEVYLFYNQGIIQDILKKMSEIYEERNNDAQDFPLGLGYQPPELETIEFMGTKYKTITLWYDNEEVPDEFKAKI